VARSKNFRPSMNVISTRAAGEKGWALKTASRVLPDLDTTHPGRRCRAAAPVVGDHPEGLVFGGAAVLDRPRGFLVESPPGPLVGIGVDVTFTPARPSGQRCGNRVPRLELVGPVVGEGRRAGPGGGDLGRPPCSPPARAAGWATRRRVLATWRQHEDLVAPVTCGVHQPLAVQHLDQRVQLEVLSRGIGSRLRPSSAP